MNVPIEHISINWSKLKTAASIAIKITQNLKWLKSIENFYNEPVRTPVTKTEIIGDLNLGKTYAIGENKRPSAAIEYAIRDNG